MLQAGSGVGFAIRAGAAFRIAALMGLALLSGCDGKSKGDGKPAGEVPDTSIKILASLEVKEFESTIIRAAATTGLALTIEYVGTTEMVDKLNQEAGWDAALTSVASYTEAALEKKPLAKSILFNTHLVLGVKGLKAKELGWDKATPTWNAVSEAAGAGKFRYGIGSPTWSASGLSAVLSASLTEGKSAEKAEQDHLSDASAKEFLSGARQVSTSLAWMGEQFMRENAVLDGIVAPESVVMRVNERMEGMADKLMLVYPTNGSVGLEFSLLHLPKGKKNAFERMSAELRDQRVQNEVVKLTRLRPAVAGVPLATGTPGVTAKQLSLSQVPGLQEAVVSGSTARWSTPGTTYLVVPANVASKGVDDGEGLLALKALVTQVPSSALQRAAVMKAGERIVLVPYSDRAHEPQEFRADASSAGGAKESLAKALDGLVGGDGLSLFEGVLAAQKMVADAIAADPKTQASVIVLVGKENSVGVATYAYQKSQEKLGGTRVQVVMYGSANRVEADGIATATGGRVFAAKKGEITKALMEAREHR